MSEQPKRRGGARPGSGPKPKGRIKRDVSLPPQVWAAIEVYREQWGIRTTGETVEELVTLQLAHQSMQEGTR
jgi:hypothetical protein